MKLADDQYRYSSITKGSEHLLYQSYVHNLLALKWIDSNLMFYGRIYYMCPSMTKINEVLCSKSDFEFNYEQKHEPRSKFLIYSS